MTEYSQAKTGEYLNDIPHFQFQKGSCCEKYLKDNKHNGCYLAQKCARIFGLEHYLFFKAQAVRFSEQMMPANKYLNKFPSLRVAVPSPRGKTGGRERLRKAGTNRVM